MRSAGRNRGGLLACCVTLLTVLALPVTALGRAGDPDTGFGIGGRAGTPAEELAPNWNGPGPGPLLRPEFSGDATHLAAAPNGSVVVARGSLLLRYLSNGRLDDGFGDNGRLRLSEVEGLPFGLSDIGFDPTGRLLVFGTVVDPRINRFIQAYAIREVSPSFATVLRLDSAGELDRSFGGGDGVFRDGLGLRPSHGVPDDVPLVEIASAKIDSKGRAVMAIGKVGFPPSVRSTPGWTVESLARLTSKGDLDPSFGRDGIVEGVIARKANVGLSFADFCICATDKPIVASREFTYFEEASEERPAHGWLSRFQEDGTPDRSFGRNGIAHASGGVGPMACERSRRTYVLQGPASYFPTNDSPSPWRVALRSSDGSAKPRFTRRAVVMLAGRYSYLSSLTVDRRGGLLLAGTLRLPNQERTRRRSFFTVIRLLPSGRLDRGFGHGGWVRTGFGSDARVNATQASIDASGNLLVAGSGRASWLQPGGVVLAGYLLRG